MNNNLNGYTLFSQPSRSASGSVAIYASKSLNAFKRTDLSTTDDEFETVWVEINNTKAKNVSCCCAYRHVFYECYQWKRSLKISDRLPQLLIVDNIKVNYKILNYCKTDYTKFDEDKFINEFTVLNWENTSNTNLEANTKFNSFYDQIS